MSKRIYLDNCCFNRPYDDQNQTRISLETEAKLKIQNMVKSGEVELVSNLGIVEAERFITVVMKEKFDYTKWQKNLFEGMNLKEFNDSAGEYAKNHPFEGNATIIE